MNGPTELMPCDISLLLLDEAFGGGRHGVDGELARWSQESTVGEKRPYLATTHNDLGTLLRRK